MQITLPSALWVLSLGLGFIVAALAILAHFTIPEPVVLIWLFVTGVLILVQK